MRHILRNVTLALALALGLCANFSAKVQKERKPSQHAAAVQRCKDDYAAAKRSAKDITNAQEQQAALAAAKRDYDDCIKEASKVP